MTRLARTERDALCDLALQVDEDQPTLCGDWTVKDLVVHLLVREGGPAAVGIAVAPLAGLTDRASRRLGRRSFEELVEKVRTGPPLLSPFRVPAVDRLVNTMEFFIHHEDIRRARPTWSPRTLGDDAERALWSSVRTAGKGLTRSAPVGVRIESTLTGDRVLLRKGDPEVVVRGRPSEVALYVFGRKHQADVELQGDDEAVARLDAASLGM